MFFGVRPPVTNIPPEGIHLTEAEPTSDPYALGQHGRRVSLMHRLSLHEDLDNDNNNEEARVYDVHVYVHVACTHLIIISKACLHKVPSLAFTDTTFPCISPAPRNSSCTFLSTLSGNS